MKGILKTMITYSKRRLLSTDDSIVSLWNEEKGVYYYVDIDTFSTACVLYSKFEESIDSLVESIGGTPDYTCVKTAIEELPKPINIYGYFLALVSKDLINFDDIVGGIMLITDVIDFNTFLSIDPAVRKRPRLASKLQDRYLPIWKKFFMSTFDYEEAIGKLTSVSSPQFVKSGDSYILSGASGISTTDAPASDKSKWDSILDALDEDFNNIDSKYKDNSNASQNTGYTGGMAILEEAKAQEEKTKKVRAQI